MRLLSIIGRMLLGAAIFRGMRRAPKWVLVIAALAGIAFMSIGVARAQSEICSITASNGRCPTKSSAYANIAQLQQAAAAAYASQYPSRGGHACPIVEKAGNSLYGEYRRGTDAANCNSSSTPLGWWARTWDTGCPVNEPWNPETGTCGIPNDCPTQPNLGNTAWSGYDAASFSICKDGCTYNDIGVGFTQTIDGVSYTRSTDWEPSGAQCTNSSLTAPAPSDTDGDGTSDGFDGSPNNPGSGGGGGEGGAQQPEDAHCGKPGQPACGENGSGSGNGNTSGGGGNCAAPPSSTGDPILAQIAYQTWSTRCAIERLGSGSGTTPGNGEGNDGQPDWTKGNGPGADTDTTDYVAESKRFGIGLSPDILDRENIFGGGTCPQFTIPVFGFGTWSTAEIPQWCGVMAPAMRGLILLMGAFTSLGILMGRFGV